MPHNKFFSYGEMDFIKQGEDISGSVASGDDGVANRVPSKVAKNTLFLKERLEVLDNLGVDLLVLQSSGELKQNCNHLIKSYGKYSLPDTAPTGSYVNLKSVGVQLDVTTTTKFPNSSKLISVNENQTLQLVKTNEGWSFSRVNTGEGWTKEQSDSRYIICKRFSITNDTSSTNWYTIASGTGNLSSRIQLESDKGSGHRNVVMYAAVSYGSDPTLNVVSNSGFRTKGFNEVRLCNEAGSEQVYSRKYLIVRVEPGATVKVTVESLGGLFDNWELSNGTHGTSSTIVNSYDCSINLSDTVISTTSKFHASELYDGGNRVYSPSNRIPWNDESISSRPQISRGTTGSYGTVQVDEYKNRYAGYSIRGQSFMMQRDTGLFGLYSDGNWLIRRDLDGPLVLSNKSADKIVCYDSFLEYKSNYGVVHIGPQNGGYCHIYTDRPKFAFNKEVDLLGNILRAGHVLLDGDITLNASSSRGHFKCNIGSRSIHWYADPNTTRWVSDVDIYIDGNGNFNDVYIRSDRSLKKDLIPLKNSLEGIMRIVPYEYNKRSPESDKYDTHEEGFVAQDWEAIFPNVVNTDPLTGLKSLKPYAIIARLFNAVQELTTRLENLESELRRGD